MEKYNEIEMVTPEEGKLNPRLCEIRFDALVTMYDVGQKVIKENRLFNSSEKVLPPQWFRSRNKITLEAIKNYSDYELGRMLKEMYFQLEQHINKYEEYRK